MNNLNLEKYLNVVNEEKIKKGLENFVPLYPMFRIEDGKLYVGVLLTAENDNVWDKEQNIKPDYWALIDINSGKVVKFNKTAENDFVVGNIIPKNVDSKQKEISKYTVEKTLQYQNYLINDIKNEQLPLQKELAELFGNDIEIDGEKVKINDYLLSNMESDIKNKIDELVKLLICSKYGSITFYYDKLFEEIVKEYQNSGIINEKSVGLCAKIMNYYYDGVIGIDNFFNIK